MVNFDELFERNKTLEKLEKNELKKNELEEIRNFSFELKPISLDEETDLLKEFLESLNNYLTVEMLKYHSPIEEEELRRLFKIRENLSEEIERRMKKIIII